MEIPPKETESTLNIAIVVSRFNQEVTQKLFDGAMKRLAELGFAQGQITTVWVPGAVEIPLTVQRLAETDRYAAIICLGAVIFGETPHFEYVCKMVSEGCMQVSLTHNIPVVFGVLTTNTLSQAQERAGGRQGNMGIYAADAVVEWLSVLEQIEEEV